MLSDWEAWERSNARRLGPSADDWDTYADSVVEAEAIAAQCAPSLRRSRVSVPPPVRRAVLERDAYRCVQCGWSADDGNAYWCDERRRWIVCVLEMDHIFPWSRGGTNEIQNLQTLCTSCNASKGAKLQ